VTALTLRSDRQNWNKELSSWGYTRPAQEFWQYAISTVKASFPNVLFLAETYAYQACPPLAACRPWSDAATQPYLQQLGFDYTYDKDLYDRLGWGNLDQLRSYTWGITAGYAAASAHCACCCCYCYCEN
jgi:hypothetical protein